MGNRLTHVKLKEHNKYKVQAWSKTNNLRLLPKHTGRAVEHKWEGVTQNALSPSARLAT